MLSSPPEIHGPRGMAGNGPRQHAAAALTLDAFPDRLDDASDFGPRRKLALRLKLILALDDEEVREVDGGGLDLKDNLREGICTRGGGGLSRATEVVWADGLLASEHAREHRGAEWDDGPRPFSARCSAAP